MQPFLWLDHLQRTDQNTVGIKALALGQLRQMGFAVPNGFVIPASRCQAFWGEVTGSSPLLMDFPNSTLWLDVDDGLQLRQVAGALQTALREQSWPQDWIEALGEALETLNSPMVILRPCGVITSESQSQWYGWPRSLHRSSRPTDRSGRPGDAPGEGHALQQTQTQRRPGLSGTETDILKMVAIEAQVCPGSVESCVAQIKQIWAALFRATSLLCWHRHDIPLESVGVAVLVQELQRPALTGTLTLEQREDRSEIQIQACQGLGFALTRGEVLPDRYHWQGSLVATAGPKATEQTGLEAVERGAVGAQSIALVGKITGQRLGHQSFGYRFYGPTGHYGLASGSAKVAEAAYLGAAITEAVVTDAMGSDPAVQKAAGTDQAGTGARGSDSAGTDDAGTGAKGSDSAGTDDAGTGAKGSDSAIQEAAGSDSAGTEAKTQEAAGSDSAGTEAETQEAAGTEAEVVETEPEGAELVNTRVSQTGNTGVSQINPATDSYLCVEPLAIREHQPLLSAAAVEQLVQSAWSLAQCFKTASPTGLVLEWTCPIALDRLELPEDPAPPLQALSQTRDPNENLPILWVQVEYKTASHPPLSHPEQRSQGYRGESAARGQAQGSVWLVPGDDRSSWTTGQASFDNPDRSWEKPAQGPIPPHSILVVQRVTAALVPLLSECKGLITEQGGLTSHGALLARELQIPAVVGVVGITQWLQSGDWVEVDGDRGEVRLLTTGIRVAEAKAGSAIPREVRTNWAESAVYLGDTALEGGSTAVRSNSPEPAPVLASPPALPFLSSEPANPLAHPTPLAASSAANPSATFRPPSSTPPLNPSAGLGSSGLGSSFGAPNDDRRSFPSSSSASSQFDRADPADRSETGPSLSPPLASASPHAPESALPYPTATSIFLTLSHPKTLTHPALQQVDGVGLIRSEWFFLHILDQHSPQAWIAQGRRQELVERLRDALLPVLQAMPHRPVFYRSFDFRVPELLSHAPLPTPQGDASPSLRNHLCDSAVFDLELEVLKQLCHYSGHGASLRLLLPFVRTPEEVAYRQYQIQQVFQTARSPLPLWIMAEVPSVLFLLEAYREVGVQGFVVGCNDLGRLLMGLDRESTHPNIPIPLHYPTVQQAIATIIEGVRALELPCVVAAPGVALNREIVGQWVRAGVTAISVEGMAIEQLRYWLMQTEQEMLLTLRRDRRFESSRDRKAKPPEL